MTKKVRHKRSVRRILAGWCGLLMYVGALSPVGLATTAFVGALDPDHLIQFQPSENGMRLVMHHEGDCSQHHHGVVARVLTVFTTPASPTDPDHVLHFSSAKSLTQASQIIVPVVEQHEFIAFISAELGTEVATGSIPFVPSPRPPPGDGGRPLSIRSTVLLI